MSDTATIQKVVVEPIIGWRLIVTTILFWTGIMGFIQISIVNYDKKHQLIFYIMLILTTFLYLKKHEDKMHYIL